MTPIDPAAKRHQSTQTDIYSTAKILQLTAPILKHLLTFLDTSTPVSKEILEPNPATDPKTIIAAARALRRRDTDCFGTLLRSERGNAELTCDLLRKAIRVINQEEDLLAIGWYKELQGVISMINTRKNGVNADRMLRQMLKKCAFLCLRTKKTWHDIPFNHNESNCSLTFLRGERLNIEITLWDVDKEAQYDKDNKFCVSRCFYMRPTVHYDKYMQVFKSLSGISLPYNGECFSYRIDSESLQPDLEPDFINRDNAVRKVLASPKFINMHPVALFSVIATGDTYFVDVYRMNTRQIFKQLSYHPNHNVRTAASLIYAVSQLHGMKIVAQEALLAKYVYIDDNNWAFLSNYPALKLAEEYSEQNNKLFAEDIRSLAKILSQVILSDFNRTMMKDFILFTRKEETPTIDVIEAHFLKLVNEHFRLDGKPPKFASLWDILMSPPLTFVQ